MRKAPSCAGWSATISSRRYANFFQPSFRLKSRGDQGCHQKRVKLFVAAVKSEADRQGHYDKIITVMSERN